MDTEHCDTCHRPRAACVCDRIVTYQTDRRVLVLQHFQEQDALLGSAQILAASLPNFFIQQIPQPAAAQDRAMRAELTSGNRETAIDGFLPLINKPGLGFDVNEQALNRYSEETV